MVCGLLQDAGIDAQAIENNSPFGQGTARIIAGIMGNFSGPDEPQVWIERADIERVQPILADLAQRNAARLSGQHGPALDVECETCGQRSLFPANQTGTVQICPHCRAYVDVEDPSGGEAEP